MRHVLGLWPEIILQGTAFLSWGKWLYIHKKGWLSRTIKKHAEPPPIPLIQIKIDTKLEKDYVKIKLRINSMSEAPSLYEFKMDLFYNGEMEGVLLFQQNYQMTLEASGNITADLKIQYLRTFLLELY